jgi:diguanylate cyclase
METSSASGEERRRAGPEAGRPSAAQALAAELAILRHGIGAAREVATEWLPGMLAAAMRATSLAAEGAARVDETVGELARSLARLSTAIEALDARVAEVAEHDRERLARLSTAIEALDARVAEVAAHASLDPLTGLLNRGALERALRAAVEEAERTGEPLSVVFCDLDGFKQFNDRHGHQAGDHALRLVAGALAAVEDERRIVGRYGGEEFVLAMPGRPEGDALFVAQTIASKVAGRVLRRRGSGEPLGPVTLSAGVARWLGPEEDATGLLRRADAAMYRAKAAGGNRAVLAAG